ncbi:unnamed protein product [Rotaria sp. Silwood2]|nr:unnamed protein product [Rotaria sp. Silwood2]
MAEVHRITQLLRERASKNLPAQSTLTALQEEELADQLFNVFESIWTSTTYNEEDETTLDNNTSDNEIDDCKDDSDERSDDPDYKEDDEKPVFESFTMSYMTRALDYYHEINPKTGKRSHSWKSIQYKFRRITHQSYMARFRDYVEQKGIKKQKIDILADHVYNNFERARDLLCPVHDMDLKRWGIRESRSMSFHNFVASDTWLLNFKHKYNICSRKIIKVVTKRELINEDDIRSSAEEFINEQRPRSSWRQRSRSLTRDTSLSPEGPRLSVQQHSFPAQRPRSAAQKHSLATSLNAPGPVICVRVNKGTIQVMSGDITAEKVDAIIGSSSSEILKKAIIQVAGNEVWTSYNIQHKNNPNSVLIPTPSGALPCKQIFFVKWQPDKNKKILQQSLVDLIGIVIQYVISYKFKSLAFPALGCGQHGCSVDIIVNTMVKEMKNQLTIRNLPLVVRFVIQPGQQNIYDEFCKQVLATQNGITKHFFFREI